MNQKRENINPEISEEFCLLPAERLWGRRKKKSFEMSHLMNLEVALYKCEVRERESVVSESHMRVCACHVTIFLSQQVGDN